MEPKLRAPEIPKPAAARFDSVLGAWVLTRYRDVLAALREPALSATAGGGAGEWDRAEHLKFRTETSAAASLEMLGGAFTDLELLARRMVKALPGNRPVDLVSELAEPWSAQVAIRMVPLAGEIEKSAPLAAAIFVAAAEPRDDSLSARAEEATRKLAAAFSGPLAAFHVQAFVALTQTLPCFLANAWLALLRHPQQAEILSRDPGLMPEAIEELLRFAGPSRAQFRRAADRVELGGAAIAKGDRVALMLAAANRDPEQFPAPERLDLQRGAPRHLAFGVGSHACIGAPLVRAAAAAITAPFVEVFTGARLVEPVEWRGGFAICSPRCLWVWRASAEAQSGPGATNL